MEPSTRHDRQSTRVDEGPADRAWLLIAEAAEALGVSEAQVRRHAPRRQMGRRVLIPRLGLRGSDRGAAAHARPGGARPAVTSWGDDSEAVVAVDTAPHATAATRAPHAEGAPLASASGGPRVARARRIRD